MLSVIYISNSSSSMPHFSFIPIVVGHYWTESVPNWPQVFFMYNTVSVCILSRYLFCFCWKLKIRRQCLSCCWASSYKSNCYTGFWGRFPEYGKPLLKNQTDGLPLRLPSILSKERQVFTKIDDSSKLLIRNNIFSSLSLYANPSSTRSFSQV